MKCDFETHKNTNTNVLIILASYQGFIYWLKLKVFCREKDGVRYRRNAYSKLLSSSLNLKL